MNKIIELIPDDNDLPDWAIKAMANGSLFKTVFEKIKEIERFKKIKEIESKQGEN